MLSTFGEAKAPFFAKLEKKKGQVIHSCVYKNRYLLCVYVLSVSLSLTHTHAHVLYVYVYAHTHMCVCVCVCVCVRISIYARPQLN
jgi:hypothetical protein